MEAARTSETLVNFYQTTRCYNPEDSNLHTHRRKNLKSYLQLDTLTKYTILRLVCKWEEPTATVKTTNGTLIALLIWQYHLKGRYGGARDKIRFSAHGVTSTMLFQHKYGTTLSLLSTLRHILLIWGPYHGLGNHQINHFRLNECHSLEKWVVFGYTLERKLWEKLNAVEYISNNAYQRDVLRTLIQKKKTCHVSTLSCRPSSNVI
jgi:hypothetical protein